MYCCLLLFGDILLVHLFGGKDTLSCAREAQWPLPGVWQILGPGRTRGTPGSPCAVWRSSGSHLVVLRDVQNYTQGSWGPDGAREGSNQGPVLAVHAWIPVPASWPLLEISLFKWLLGKLSVVFHPA